MPCLICRDLELEDSNIDGSLLHVHLDYTQLSLVDVSNETEWEEFRKNFVEKNVGGPPENGK